MPRILTADLGEASVRAALVETSFRNARVESLLSERVTNGATPFEVLGTLIEKLGAPLDWVACTIPGNAFSHRLLELPFSDRRKLEETVPFELEGHVPFDLERHTVSFVMVNRGAEGACMVLAALADTQTLRSYLRSLHDVGVDPLAMDLAPVAAANLLLHLADPARGEEGLVDISGDRLLVALARHGGFAGMRACRLAGEEPADIARLVRWSLLGLGSEGPAALSRIWLGGSGESMAALGPAISESTGVETKSVNRASLALVPEELRDRQAEFVVPLGLALREDPHPGTVALNLRQGELAYHGKREELRQRLGRLGALAAIGLVLLVAAGALEAGRERSRITDLKAQIRSIFNATLPRVTRVVNEKAQLEAAYAELQKKRQLFGGVLPSADKVVDLLRAMTEAIPPAAALDVEELTIEARAVKLAGNVPSFEAVDLVKNALSSIPICGEVTVADVKASVDGQSVSFRATMPVRTD